MMRWGGIFSDYYRWREGVGPRERPATLVNLLWGGIESNQVGTSEFVGFCREVGAEPLVCVNFESDGRRQVHGDSGRASARPMRRKPPTGWRYCNTPDTRGTQGTRARRRRYGIRHWQIGNETSYDRNGFDLETAARKTVEFATAMRRADAIGAPDCLGRQRVGRPDGGDRGRARSISRLPSHARSGRPEAAGVCAESCTASDPDATWAQLMKAWELTDAKIRTMREAIKGRPHSARPDRVPLHDSGTRSLRRARHLGGRRVLRAHPEQSRAARRRARRSPLPRISAARDGRTTP